VATFLEAKEESNTRTFNLENEGLPFTFLYEKRSDCLVSQRQSPSGALAEKCYRQLYTLTREGLGNRE